MKIEFFMNMVPPATTAQEHKVGIRNGKPFFYDPPGVKRAKVKLLDHLFKFAPDEMFTAPVRLVVKWCFPIKGAHNDGEYKATRPDTDNLQKMLKDAMTELSFWKDDALVVSEIVEKFWAKHPGIYIYIEEV